MADDILAGKPYPNPGAMCAGLLDAPDQWYNHAAMLRVVATVKLMHERLELAEKHLKGETASRHYAENALSEAQAENASLAEERDDLKAKLASLQRGECQCWQESGAKERTHSDHCPEQAARLMRGYCNTIKDLKAKLEAAMAGRERQRALGRAEAWEEAAELSDYTDAYHTIHKRAAEERAKISGPSATADKAQNQGEKK